MSINAKNSAEKPKNLETTSDWIFNGQKYNVEIRLHNSDVSLPISPGSVISLSVTESIYGIFPSVVLILDNSGNYVENTVSDVTSELHERVFTQSFHFDSDSRESFYISIGPVVDSYEAGSYAPDHYSFTGWYYIYDEDEGLQGSGSMKQKTYYLRDIREQYLVESNLQWSTTDVIKSQSKFKYNTSQISNRYRQAKTGDSIKHLLAQTFKVPIDDFPVDGDWDQGHNSVHYSSPTQNTAYDDLEYLLDRHISNSTQDNCILTAERDGNFSLRSLSSMFENGALHAGLSPFVIDFFVGDGGTFTTSTDPDVTGSALPGHAITEQDLDKFDGLDNFSLLHVANVDSVNELVTTIVHSYDRTNKQFNIDCDRHHICTVKDNLQSLYADKMPGRRGAKYATAIMPMNERKFDNEIVNHTTGKSGSLSERLVVGANKTLKKALAFAPCINFEAEGSGHRTIGRFIVLSLKNADKDAPLTKLLVGEWLTSKINHAFVFSSNVYVNNITCVKPYSNEELGSAVDINLENLHQTQDQWGVPAGSTDLDNLNLQPGEVIV